MPNELIVAYIVVNFSYLIYRVVTVEFRRRKMMRK